MQTFTHLYESNREDVQVRVLHRYVGCKCTVDRVTRGFAEQVTGKRLGQGLTFAPCRKPHVPQTWPDADLFSSSRAPGAFNVARGLWTRR